VCYFCRKAGLLLSCAIRVADCAIRLADCAIRICWLTDNRIVMNKPNSLGYVTPVIKPVARIPGHNRFELLRRDTEIIGKTTTQIRKKLLLTRQELKEAQQRITELENRVNKMEIVMRRQYHDDIICDWLGFFYSKVVIDGLKQRGFNVDSMNQVTLKIHYDINTTTEEKERLKQACCDLAGVTEEEWDLCYRMKKERNRRAHPRIDFKETRKIVNQQNDDKIKRALIKMLDQFDAFSNI
jgi:hypothetical protein